MTDLRKIVIIEMVGRVMAKKLIAATRQIERAKDKEEASLALNHFRSIERELCIISHKFNPTGRSVYKGPDAEEMLREGVGRFGGKAAEVLTRYNL